MCSQYMSSLTTAIQDLTDSCDKYQAVIDMIYKTSGKQDRQITAAYHLACAIKECMTHQDEFGADHGYIHEKISRALSQLGMKAVDPMW